MGLELVEIAMAVEEEFSIEVSSEDGSIWRTCGDLSAYVTKALNARGDMRAEAEVWEQLKQIIVEQIGVKPEEVSREAKFVEDLGCG